MYNISTKEIRLKRRAYERISKYSVYAIEFCFFGIIVGLNIKSMIESNKGEEGKANYYKHLALQTSVLTIVVVAFTVAVKAVFNF